MRKPAISVVDLSTASGRAEALGRWPKDDSQPGGCFANRAMAEAALAVPGGATFAVFFRAGGGEAVLPLRLESRLRVTVAVPAGDPVAQYTALCGGEPDAEAVAGFGDALSALGIDAVDLPGLFADGPLARALSGAVDVASTGALCIQLAGCEGSDGFLDRFGSSTRKGLRQKLRRLGAFGPQRVDIATGAAALPALEDALAMKRDWLRRHAQFSRVLDDPAAAALLLRWAAGLGEKLVVGRLLAGDRVLAHEVAIREEGNRLLSYLATYDEAAARCSPGTLLTLAMVDWCIAHGMTAIDLLPPADDHKRWLARGGPEMTVVHRILPFTVAGKAYAYAAASALPAARRLYRALPGGLRLGIGRTMFGGAD